MNYIILSSAQVVLFVDTLFVDVYQRTQMMKLLEEYGQMVNYFDRSFGMLMKPNYL